MTPEEATQLNTLLGGVEKDSHGQPIVLSRYGFKIMDVNGKKFVVAATPKEVAERIAERDGRALAEVLNEVETSSANCLTAGATYNCYPQGGCRVCDKVYIGGGHWNCICNG